MELNIIDWLKLQQLLELLVHLVELSPRLSDSCLIFLLKSFNLLAWI